MLPLFDPSMDGHAGLWYRAVRCYRDHTGIEKTGDFGDWWRDGNKCGVAVWVPVNCARTALAGWLRSCGLNSHDRVLLLQFHDRIATLYGLVIVVFWLRLRLWYLMWISVPRAERRALADARKKAKAGAAGAAGAAAVASGEKKKEE